jgi:hypothetical protein
MRRITNDTVNVPERFILTVTDLYGREDLHAGDDLEELRQLGRLTSGAGRTDVYDSAEDKLIPVRARR